MSPALCASQNLVILYFFRYRLESTKYLYLGARGTPGRACSGKTCALGIIFLFSQLLLGHGGTSQHQLF